MKSRRTFIKKCLAGWLAITVPGWTACSVIGRPHSPITRRNPKRGLVIWYSQTGHTRRIGRLIQHTWQKAGLTVDGGDYREMGSESLNQYDLIALGSPVYYMDVPVNLRDWIKTLPRIDGTTVAAYVTFGGHGDGQHNTACELLEQMTLKGGAPADIGLFGNMSTFAPTWSMGNEDRIMEFKDRPNEKTYRQACIFAGNILENVAIGQTYEIDREFGLDTLMKLLPGIALTKLMITDHHINQDLCIECGACIDKCPVGAISLETGVINSKRCIACMGCINNCPANAVQMNFLGTAVYGFKEFLKRNHIDIMEPAELGLRV